MDMQQAIELAATVESHRPRLRVVAIGRFRPADQIDDAAPWGVSVIAGRDGRPKVLWSPEELAELLPRPARAKPRKTEAELGLVQPGLF